MEIGILIKHGLLLIVYYKKSPQFNQNISTSFYYSAAE